jgi:hypothetical protein
VVSLLLMLEMVTATDQTLVLCLMVRLPGLSFSR